MVCACLPYDTSESVSLSHLECKELLQNNSFCVSWSSDPRSSNAIDIIIERTINYHAKSQGDIIGFGKSYSAGGVLPVISELNILKQHPCTWTWVLMRWQLISSCRRPNPRVVNLRSSGRVVDAVSGFTILSVLISVRMKCPACRHAFLPIVLWQLTFFKHQKMAISPW